MAASNRKAGACSRTRNAVSYGVKYTARHRVSQGKVQGIFAHIGMRFGPNVAVWLPSLNSQSVHGGNGGGAVCGNDGGEKGADAERARGDSQGKGIPRGNAIELGGEQSSCADGEGQAEHESNRDALEGPAEDEAKDVRAVRAERHADADLVGFLGDGIGSDTVEANGGKDQRDNAKQAGEA